MKENNYSDILYLIRDRLDNSCKIGCSSLTKDLQKLFNKKHTAKNQDNTKVSFYVDKDRNYLTIYVGTCADKETHTTSYYVNILIPFSIEITNRMRKIVETDLDEAKVMLDIKIHHSAMNEYISIQEIEEVCGKWGLNRYHL